MAKKKSPKKSDQAELPLDVAPASAPKSEAKPTKPEQPEAARPAPAAA